MGTLSQYICKSQAIHTKKHQLPNQHPGVKYIYSGASALARQRSSIAKEIW